MARPGVTVTTRDAPPSSGPPIRTGTAFIAGVAERGRTDRAQLVESMADFERLYGDRVSSSYLHDSVDTYFREGGGSAYIARVIGPTASTASAYLLDADGEHTLLVSAVGEGDWGNDLTVSVASASGVLTLSVKDADDNVIDTYATTGGKQAFLDYEGFKYVTVTDEHAGGVDPSVVSDVAFTGGTDNTAGITDAEYGDALDLFIGGYGPGQVLIPGSADPDVHELLLLHASTHNRVALLDGPDSNVLATIEAAATAARDTGLGDHGAMFVPYVKVPSATVGASRSIPYSAVQAGLEARRDRIASQNIPAAGRSYPLNFAMSLKHDFSDDDRTELIGYGVNTAHTVGGVRETYGYRSLADPETESNWVQFNYARLRMAITASGEDIGETFLFSQIDGKGLKLSEFGSAIAGMLLDYFTAGSLYGDTPDEAFRVDVGSSVNTAETIAAGELHAVAGVRMSPHAEMVVIEFVKTPITQSV